MAALEKQLCRPCECEMGDKTIRLMHRKRRRSNSISPEEYDELLQRLTTLIFGMLNALVRRANCARVYTVLSTPALGIFLELGPKDLTDASLAEMLVWNQEQVLSGC